VDEPSKASPACLVARNDLIPNDERRKAARRSSWARFDAGNHRSTKSRVGRQSSYAPAARSDSPMGVGSPPQFDHAGPSDEAPGAPPAFLAAARSDAQTRPVRRNTGYRLGAARGRRLSCDQQFELDVAAYGWNKRTCIVSINNILRKFLLEAKETHVFRSPESSNYVPLKRPPTFSIPVAARCLVFSVIPAGSLAQAGAALVRFADLIRPEPSSHAPVSVSPLVDTAWQVHIRYPEPFRHLNNGGRPYEFVERLAPEIMTMTRPRTSWLQYS
jgi:hypothetical protein